MSPAGRAKPTGPFALEHPFPEPPAPGAAIEVAPGIHWLRFALPFLLNHVNVYLVDDGEGWAIIDTGIMDDLTKATWEEVIAGPFGRRGFTRVIGTHFHSDHVGLAGWLCERLKIPLWMSHGEFFMMQYLKLAPLDRGEEAWREFYTDHGMPPALSATLVTRGHRYMKMVSEPPNRYSRLAVGGALDMGGRRFDVTTGGGHAPDQAMLEGRGDRVFFAADQVLARISPNISVNAFDPEGDPLGEYLRSLALIRATVHEDSLVLPGHGIPFRGLHRRAAELEDHHDHRCGLVMEACEKGPRNCFDLVPAVFHRPLDAHQMGFAFTETLAHANRLVREGRLTRRAGRDGYLFALP